MSGGAVRWPLVVLAVVAVVGLAVADRGEDQSPASAVLAGLGVTSAAPGPEAEGGVWYCGEGTSRPGEFADHSVIVANPSAVAVTAAVSVFPATPAGSVSASAAPREVTLAVPARSEASLRLAEVVESQYTAALVEVDSGQAVVEQRVQGPTGMDVMACATRSSAVWHFAAGSTRRDARLGFTLFNPFPDRAVVQFTFSTDAGVRKPQSLRGVLVPARSLVVVNATNVVPRFSSVSTTIESQAGRIVAGRLQLFDGTEGLEGLTAGPGIPEPQTQWVFPGGPTDSGMVEHIVLYNPSQQVASAFVGIRLDTSGSGGAPAPFEVSVPPRQQIALVLGDIGAYPLPPEPFAYSVAGSLPDGVGIWTALQVYNGVPIVAERVAAAPATSAPAGVATAAGSPVTAVRHLIAGSRAGGAEVVLAVVNPSPDSIALVTVSKIADGQAAPVAQLDPLEVAPHSRVVVPVDRLADGDSYALLVEASQPVAVGRSLLAREGTGSASSAATPFDPIALDPSAF
ncbi:DUF5719 family protein [Candidatus Poriferisocius sp.]|uniref:DUF5719 family protein n=1 Tax=Candidatus Poriferisocius sp. TaxID=3101276 RepID=UPI003B01AFF3